MRQGCAGFSARAYRSGLRVVERGTFVLSPVDAPCPDPDDVPMKTWGLAKELARRRGVPLFSTRRGLADLRR